jgi:2-polyprenyl-3-methyl-5-hydroxy-6-metoxy-1,4-benzoquinol methylase
MEDQVNSFAGVANETLGSDYRGQSRPEVMALLPPLKPGAMVLEVGCGEGAFCAGLSAVSETWGIEPDARSAEVARARLHKVLVGTFHTVKAELPFAHFDLIVCNDVIEHMTDHDAFLREIQDHMAPGCLFLGSVPNVRFYRNLFNILIVRDWHYQDWGILDRTHFRFFTFRSLRRSLEDAGFSLQRFEGLNETKVSDFSVRNLLEGLFKTGLIMFSGGAARDIKFMQIGFLATRSAE